MADAMKLIVQAGLELQINNNAGCKEIEDAWAKRADAEAKKVELQVPPELLMPEAVAAPS